MNKIITLGGLILILNSCSIRIPLNNLVAYSDKAIQKHADKTFSFIENKNFRFKYTSCINKFYDAKDNNEYLIVNECKEAYKISKEECLINKNIKYCYLLKNMSTDIFKSDKMYNTITSILDKEIHEANTNKILKINNLLYQNESILDRDRIIHNQKLKKENPDLYLMITAISKTSLITKNGFKRLGNWYKAKEYCENLTLEGYSNWRLANESELLKISNYKLFLWTKKTKNEVWKQWFKRNKYKRNLNYRGSELFVKQEFINNIFLVITPKKIAISPYWSSTSNEKHALLIDFHTGISKTYNKNKNGIALCVQNIAP